MSYWSQSSFQSTHIHSSKTIPVIGNVLACSEGKADTNSCGGSYRAPSFRALLPHHRELHALVLLLNRGVSAPLTV